MAISNFIIPTGLQVSGTTTITGSVNISGTLTNIGDISGSRGDYTSLFINGVAVSAGGVDATQVSGAITGALAEYSSQVSGAITGAVSNLPTRSEVSGVLTASYAQLGVTNTFTAAQVITGGLSMTGDLTASSGSLLGDLTIGGNLTVRGTASYIDSTTVNIGDTNINLGTGSTDLSILNGGGLDLGTSAQVQWRYSNSANAWTSNVGLSSSVDLKAPAALVTALTGTTTTGSIATFTTISGSSISSSISVRSPSIVADRFGSSNIAFQILTTNSAALDQFTQALYGAVKYIIKAKDNVAGESHAMEVLVTTDGTRVQHTPYASTYTGTSALISISSTISLGVVTVTVNNLSANTVDITVMKLCVG